LGTLKSILANEVECASLIAMKLILKSAVTVALMAASCAMGDVAPALLERAEKGEAAAQVELASIYQRGEAVTKDSEAAVKWLRQAAEQGHREAQMMLGGIYVTANGVKKNSVEASKWFMLSAQQGNVAAQTQAARMHMTGAGVPKDNVEAYKWANVAAAQGDSAARKIRVFLVQRMTRAEISDGQRRTRDFLEGKRLEKTLDAPVEQIPTEATEPESPAAP
jgi:TPR repeat protein